MKFEITKQQILELNNNSEKLKEWFPEAFENNMEAGKWYNHEEGECLAFVEKIIGKDFIGYGFVQGRYWIDSNKGWTHGFRGWEEATEEEVFEALKNEAIKRGFVEGAYFKSPVSCDNHKFKNIFFTESTDMIWSKNGGVIFLNGKWATIIETITKEEAEKLLNKKIID